MSLEPIGIFLILISTFLLFCGYAYVLNLFIVSMLLGAAAAILVGSANVQPAQISIIYLLLISISSKDRRKDVALALMFPAPAFWLILFVIYGTLLGVIIPRLAAGATQIVPIGSADYDTDSISIPLMPVSGNYTQPLYMIGNVICLILIQAACSNRESLVSTVNAVLLASLANIAFAVFDVVTYATSTAYLMDFMRNAQYTLHLDEELYGLKRIAGSFTEASAFAQNTLGLSAFTATLWVTNRQPTKSGPLALISIVLVAASTSTTGLLGLLLLVAIMYTTAISRSGLKRSSRRSVAVVLLLPITIVGIVTAIYLNESTRDAVTKYIEILVIDKSTSQSGIERSSWNELAALNFLDTWGMGVGLGTSRASSFALALISNTGVIGTLLYLSFISSALSWKGRCRDDLHSDIRLAATNAVLTLLGASIISGALVDQGLLYYMFLGLAAAPLGKKAL